MGKQRAESREQRPESRERLRKSERKEQAMSDETKQSVTVRVRRNGATAGPMVPEYLTKQQVAQRLNISLRTVDSLMKRGVLPYHKLGRLVRFQPADVDAHLGRTCRVCRVNGESREEKAESRKCEPHGRAGSGEQSRGEKAESRN